MGKKPEMLRRIGMVLALLLCVALVGSPAWAMGHGNKKPAKKAILLVTFGTSVPRAQKVFTLIDKAYRKAFPGVELRWAYTAKFIRDKVAKRGIVWLAPEEALAKLMAQGYNRIAVQSLHVIAGAEYHDLLRVVHGFNGMIHGFKALVGNPLCATTDDLRRVVKLVLAAAPKGRKKGEALVYMGHGTHHPGGVAYPALAYVMRLNDPLAFMGTVEGYPTLDDVKEALLAHKVKTAYLLPFMTVAGDHAMNDMAGDEPDSWKSVLEKAGIKCKPVLKAITEDPQVIQVWIDHTKAVMKHFK